MTAGTQICFFFLEKKGGVEGKGERMKATASSSQWRFRRRPSSTFFSFFFFSLLFLLSLLLRLSF